MQRQADLVNTQIKRQPDSDERHHHIQPYDQGLLGKPGQFKQRLNKSINHYFFYAIAVSMTIAFYA
ncbi:hypothetical protein [Comamonas guangdongensis]|uniref:hypothetical protein n=1 Tax=Comamonas guangdongensis TaxID=510515 RepID=UPI0034E1C474